jgi:hypothetical protein
MAYCHIKGEKEKRPIDRICDANTPLIEILEAVAEFIIAPRRWKYVIKRNNCSPKHKPMKAAASVVHKAQNALTAKATGVTGMIPKDIKISQLILII